MTKQIRVKMANRDASIAYIALPGNPVQVTAGIVARTVCLDDIIDGFLGPRVHLDFDKSGRLIGIEILVFEKDRDVETAMPTA